MKLTDLVALLTAEGLLPRVNPHMSHQLRGFGKSFAAVGTHVTEAGPVDSLAHDLEPLQAGLEPLVVQLVLLILLRAESYRLDFNYLWTYDLYSPLHNVSDAWISIMRASGRRLGLRVFWTLWNGIELIGLWFSWCSLYSWGQRVTDQM